MPTLPVRRWIGRPLLSQRPAAPEKPFIASVRPLLAHPPSSLAGLLFGAASFCYDRNGNLTADGATVYLYDVENRLVEARVQQSAACPTATSGYGGTLTAALRYDPMGRLYEISGPNPASTTRLLYDGDALIAEYDAPASGTPTLLRRYVHGPGVDEPLVWYEGSTLAATGLRRLRANWQGSVVAVTNSAGTPIAINRYDDYGIPDPGNIGRFQYTGQAWLAELGMYHYKARIYSPTLGRFLQTDPIGYEDQMNLYAYVGNDPVNRVDPTGKICRMVGEDKVACTVEIRGSGKNGAITVEDRQQAKRLATQYARSAARIINAERSGARLSIRSMQGTRITTPEFSVSASSFKQNLFSRRFFTTPKIKRLSIGLRIQAPV